MVILNRSDYNESSPRFSAGSFLQKEAPDEIRSLLFIGNYCVYWCREVNVTLLFSANRYIGLSVAPYTRTRSAA